MKRFAYISMLAVALSFIPMVSHAHAATVLDQIMDQAISQNPTGAKVQDLARIKKAVDQGNKDELLGILAEKTGRSDLATVAQFVGSGNVVDKVQAAVRQEVQRRLGDKLAPITSANALQTAVEGAVRQEVQQRIAAKLGPYQQGLTMLAGLFKHSDLNPKSAQDNNSLAGAPQNYSKVLQMTATAYAPGPQDNGKWGNRTYVGGLVRKGVVAVDPRVIPLGTRLWVEGYGPAVAEDEGSAIVGNRIDLAFNSSPEAENYGIKPVKVYVLK